MSLAEDRRPGLGIDIGGTKLLMVCGERQARWPTGPAAGAAEIEAAIARQLADWQLGPGELGAIGVAIPGLVDRAGTVLVSNVLPRLGGWSPAAALAPLRAPVLALNDAEAALVEEAQDLTPDATVALVMAGTAIGAAFRVDGRPLRGASGWAGELGFFPERDAGGTLRTLDERAGGGALARRLGLDGAALSARAGAGDAAVLAAIAAAGDALGLALAGLVNLFNPHRLVLGGGTLALPGYEAAARQALVAAALPPLWAGCELRLAGSGPQVVARGALRAALARISGGR